MTDTIDLTNTQFNRLTVLYLDAIIPGKGAYWICSCVCGSLISAWGRLLRLSKVQSCGCLRLENSHKNGKNLITHGFIKKNGIKGFYLSWHGMKQRCLDKNSPSYKYYGGRSIGICDRWLESFENFRDDMYKSYLKHVEEFGQANTSIERINVQGNYEPSNCRWATRTEQQNNRRISLISTNKILHRKINKRLRSVLWQAIKNNSKNSYIVKYLGCAISEFKKYIESLFLPGMTWENHGNGVEKWNLDHIKPVREFDLTLESEIYLCYNYKNFQPLWARDNRTKQ